MERIIRVLLTPFLQALLRSLFPKDISSLVLSQKEEGPMFFLINFFCNIKRSAMDGKTVKTICDREKKTEKLLFRA